MAVTIRNAEGEEIDVSEEMFDQVYQHQGYERTDTPPSIRAMTRDELNAHAAEAGIADPESYPNKQALIEAIEGEPNGPEADVE